MRTLFVLAVALLAGCASTGVTTESAVAVAGGLKDAELYHESKLAADETGNDNLAAALHKVADLEGQLTIERAAADGKVSKDEALKALATMNEDLRGVRTLLENTRKAQLAAEEHYQGLRAILRSTVGLVSALAEREQAERQLQERGTAVIQAGADAAKRLGVAGATGGIGR